MGKTHRCSGAWSQGAMASILVGSAGQLAKLVWWAMLPSGATVPGSLCLPSRGPSSAAGGVLARRLGMVSRLAGFRKESVMVEMRDMPYR